YRVLTESFRRSLLAENRAPRTVQTYLEALRLFGDYVVGQGMPTEIAHIRRDHVESFIAELLVRFKPATASNRYRALQVFFKWAIDEGELRDSPMRNMKPPIIPENPPAVLSVAQLETLLKSCSGRSFEDRRDTAIIRVLLDT